VGFASRGLRDLDEGLQQVVQEAERSALRRQALGVFLKSLGWTALVTAVLLLLP